MPNIEYFENNNKIIGDIEKINSKIVFSGKNNCLYCNRMNDETLRIIDSLIEFKGDNSIVFLEKGNIKVFVTMYTDCNFYIGRQCSTNGKLTAIVTEHSNVIIGDDSLFSFNIWLRTGDAHLIFDAETKKRINFSKDILIGDHVWIGQDSIILKNSVIGSGSIVGAKSVVANKKLKSNCSYAGAPVKCIKENVFFSKDCSHNFNQELTEKFSLKNTDAFVYENNNRNCLDKLMLALSSSQSTDERIGIFLNIVRDKNRFAF